MCLQTTAEAGSATSEDSPSLDTEYSLVAEGKNEDKDTDKEQM